MRSFEIRCPVHGFIPFSEWEREVINQPTFQRLRRIRQLAWTDYVYPGAMHTRFEHSLGVMHIASQLFDAVHRRSSALLPEEWKQRRFRDRQLIRFAGLLHDVGHGPFSHAAEDVFPLRPNGKHYKHEAYSAAAIRFVLKDAIEGHSANRDWGITADEIADLLEGRGTPGPAIFWRQLIDGQMDADRMDYLLRDSLHLGVDYGKYDWKRLLNTIEAIEKKRPDSNDSELLIGINEGGVHAAVALVLARYYMFMQAYFHKTRVAYDHHYRLALKELLPGGVFPEPTEPGISEYLKWDDWRVLGLLANGDGGEHGDRLRRREHYREVYSTRERAEDSDLNLLGIVKRDLGGLVAAIESSATSAYKPTTGEIVVVSEDDRRGVRPLTQRSAIVGNLTGNSIDLRRIFVRPEDAVEARSKVNVLLRQE
jgi:hypothetical protein